MNFVHRKSHKIFQNYQQFFILYKKSPLNLGISAKWNVLIYFQLSKGQSFYRIPQEIWLTLSRFTGRQEKKDALIEGILKITLWARLSSKSYKIQCFYFWQCVMWPPPSLTYVKKLSHLNFLTWGWPPSLLFGQCQQIYCFFLDVTP